MTTPTKAAEEERTAANPAMRWRVLHGPGLRKTLGALALEALVVALGLYGALLLDAYRENRQEAIQRRQILVSMRDYLQAVATETRQSAAETEAELVRPFQTSYERGEMPRLQPILTGASGMSTGVWEAMLAAGGINVLHPRLINEIEMYYSNVRHGMTVIERFEQMTRQHVLPMMDADIKEFYDPRTTKLRARYSWYPTMLADYAEKIDRLATESDKIVRILDDHLKRME